MTASTDTARSSVGVVLVLLALVLEIVGCSSGGEEFPPDATVILGVEARPNPVSIASPVRLSVTVRDSGDVDLGYQWTFFNAVRSDTTRQPFIDWVSPSVSGSFEVGIQVFREGDFSDVRDVVTITATDPRSGH